jgi:hypothetical protein
VNPPIPSQILIWLVGVIFGAGAAWGTFARMRKDMNGIGAATRRNNWNTLIALMVITEKREDRQCLADLLRQQ